MQINRNASWVVTLFIILLGFIYLGSHLLGEVILPVAARPSNSTNLQGVWVQSRSIATREQLIETIQRIETGGFNTIFVEVIVGSGAFYNSNIVRKHATVADDFDPLALMIEEAHQRNVQVHTWFPVAYMILNHSDPSPDWRVVSADGSQNPPWANFAHPDARRWMIDAMVEVVMNYDIDGIHLDTIRYPEANVSFDSYSAQEMAARYQINLELLRGTGLPAFAFFRGNPLTRVDTAQTLAQFEHGVPAVLLNRYKDGQVIVLNWMVGERPMAASSQILGQSISFLQKQPGTPVYLLADNEFSAPYQQRNVRLILEELGIEPIPIKADALVKLEHNEVLVMPNVYSLPDQMINGLETLVGGGGGVIFIDGPVPSIHNPELQQLTGTRGGGRYFERFLELQPINQHPIIPVSAQEKDTDYRELWNKWNEFRTESVNAFVKETYKRVKNVKPDVIVSAAVKSQPSAAARTLQDWPSWLKNGNIDLIIPMAYVDDDLELQRNLLAWRLTTKGNSASITPGLSVDFKNLRAPLHPKSIEQVLGEIKLSRTNGYRGFVLFDLEHMSDELLHNLSDYASSYRQ